MELIFDIIMALGLFALWIKNNYVEDELKELKDELGA